MAGSLLALGAAVFTGCSGTVVPRPDPAPGPPVPFSELRVTEVGGIDGRFNVLVIRTDGVAVLMGRAPSAGQLADAKLSRLRALLESEQFRREVAAASESSPEPPQCTDQITVELRMGSLAISRTGPCPSDDGRRPMPAYDEILSIVNAPLHGQFDRPVPAGPPVLVPVRLEAQTTATEPGYQATVDARGRGTLTRSGSAPVRRTLPAESQDTLRLLIPRLTSASPTASPTACAEPGRHRVTTGGRDPVTVVECGYGFTQPELRAIVALLQRDLAA